MEIDGLQIQFPIFLRHMKSALPITTPHDWPGSVIKFLKVIGLLIHPAEYGGDTADAWFACHSTAMDSMTSLPRLIGMYK